MTRSLLSLSILAAFLPACGGSGTTGDDTGWADADTDTDSDTDTDFFDTYIVFVSFDGGVDEDEIVSHYYDGEEYPPYFELMFAEEGYFDAYDDRYTCAWYGSPIANGYDDLSQGDHLWIGWDLSLQYLSTDCDNFDPEIWGANTPTDAIESMAFGFGFGPTTEEFQADVENNWGVDWETDWEPYVFSGYVAFWSEDDDALVGSETNYAWNFEVDGDFTVLTEEEDGYDYLVYADAPEDMPVGYVRSNSFWGWDGFVPLY